MLLMVEKGIRGGRFHAIRHYAKANNKYMKDYDKSKESSYLKYWYVNKLYGWAMSQKLFVNNFEWIEEASQFNEDFIKNYNDGSDEGYFLEVDVEYPKKLHGLHNESPNEIQKVEKLIANLWNKNEYVTHIISWKQALNIGLPLTKVHRVIKFSQKYCLKPYIEMKTELKPKARNNFGKDFFKFKNHAVFGKNYWKCGKT